MYIPINYSTNTEKTKYDRVTAALNQASAHACLQKWYMGRNPKRHMRRTKYASHRKAKGDGSKSGKENLGKQIVHPPPVHRYYRTQKNTV